MSVPDVLGPQERLVLSLRGLYESYGYTRFPMRRFEEYALYLENKSFLTSESVLSFTNASGQLMALKPDVTLSIVKRARPERGQVEKLYYHESVYRLSATDHEFTEIGQLGVELLGDVDLYGACEVLRLAIESLRLTGADFVLDVSHMGFAGGLLGRRGAGRRTARAGQPPHPPEKRARAGAHALTVAGTALLCRAHIPAAHALRRFHPNAAPCGGYRRGDGHEAGCGRAFQPVRGAGRAGLMRACAAGLFHSHDLDYYNGLVFQGYVEGRAARGAQRRAL